LKSDKAFSANFANRASHTRPTEGRIDILTRPAADWIIRTTSLESKARIEIATIGLRTPKNVAW
jgi:hypothetical protein